MATHNFKRGRLIAKVDEALHLEQTKYTRGSQTKSANK